MAWIVLMDYWWKMVMLNLLLSTILKMIVDQHEGKRMEQFVIRK